MSITFKESTSVLTTNESEVDIFLSPLLIVWIFFCSSAINRVLSPKRIINIFYTVESFNNAYLNQIKLLTEYLAGFVLTVLFLYILGIIISNVFGKRLYLFFEDLLSRIPIVNKIYSTIKGITDTISSQNKNSFQKVVIIQYPREGLWTYAMVTGECKNENNEEYYNLFVPTTPNPTSGYLIIIKKNDVINTDISVDDGLSIIISGGMISPNTIDIKWT